MMRDREDYITPVGFAREPAVEIRRWVGRILLGIVVALLAYVLFNNVFTPQDTQPPRPGVTQDPELPAPV